ncbi:helix-turn-helix transcriptional regulator [Chitinophaga sp. LS1]|uniref:helix-turn-helix transcriptional regulator n=1 Tax=Chitinophaga sp. LS1 TaxID=3051176 RepID=UPI002AAB6CB0|nr:helix-turn-helix transcriptional regulator [Chitinophaga sp. LS1]WPV63998.1 helix-turn-helix transcriptional regulator [Chitinophaga sp. LS1]
MHEKLTIVEAITDEIVVGEEDFYVKLAYLPKHSFFDKSGTRQHNHMNALPCSTFSKIVPKPFGDKYLESPKTLNEKILNKRLEKRMLQREVANFIGVTEDCVTLWENNRSNPMVKYYPKIIEFLGYFPFQIDISSLAGKIKYYRYIKGVTQEDLAKNLGVNESTVFHYEKGTHKPKGRLRQVLSLLLSDIDDI